jgi:hypothetical protein
VPPVSGGPSVDSSHGGSKPSVTPDVVGTAAPVVVGASVIGAGSGRCVVVGAVAGGSVSGVVFVVPVVAGRRLRCRRHRGRLRCRRRRLVVRTARRRSDHDRRRGEQTHHLRIPVPPFHSSMSVATVTVVRSGFDAEQFRPVPQWADVTPHSVDTALS